MVQGTSALQERRVLNDAIESAYIECAGLSAGIRTHKVSGRGVLSDLYEQFHYNLGILFDLTSDLQEIQSDKDSIIEVKEWLDAGAPKEKDIGKRCDAGMKAFREYKRALNNCGLISLPARGK